MKKITAFFALTIFSLAILSPFSFAARTASAQSSGYTIQNVDHEIELMYSGHLIIRDTIRVTGQLTDDFLIGFPKTYGAHVLKGIAYDANGILPMSLDVPFEDHSDLYGASISFPEGSPKVFTVVFILSNDLAYQNNTINAAAAMFPAYPSLAQKASTCNVTLVLPDFASSITVTKDGESVTTTNFVKNNLAAFTSSPAYVTFLIPIGILQIFSVETLNRVITVNPAGDVVASDSYRIVNNANDSLVAFGADIPLAASNIVGRDELGRNLPVEIVGSGSTFHLVNATLISPLTTGKSISLTIEYALPRASSEQITTFLLNLELFPYLDYYVTEASVTIIPPEGANFLTYNSYANLHKDGFQETLTINKASVSHIDLDTPSENTLQIKYSYNPLWLSLNPTIWIWALAAVAFIVVVVWRRPKTSAPLKTATAKPSLSLSPEHIRAFIDAYKEKNRITSELSLLNVRAQKGKISRRRYKVQKSKLKLRLDALSKEIVELKEILRGAGGNYASLVRRLDTAETDFDQAETDINSVEARYRKGEISLEEHKKLLQDYQRRKEKAETAINGILLRIREETH